MDRKFQSFAEMFFHRTQLTPLTEAFRFPSENGWDSMNWQELFDQVQRIACALHSFGLRRGGRCALLSSTSVDWIAADLGIVCAGGVTTTIHTSDILEECLFILNDSHSELVFVENEIQLEKLKKIRSKIPKVKQVICFQTNKKYEDWIVSLCDFEKIGKSYHADHPDVFLQTASSLMPEDVATLMYTSGTTGRPKGVEILHDSWVYVGTALAKTKILEREDFQLLWLPLSHSFGKSLEAAQIAIGFASAVDSRVENIFENIKTMKPTFMAAPPRVFERIYNTVILDSQKSNVLKHKAFSWAMNVGRNVSKLYQKGRKPHGLLAFEFWIVKRFIFDRLNEQFGGRLKFFIAGSAPLSTEIAEFFHAAGILILEGYGLTESSAASFVNLPYRYKIGSVGLPIPGTQVKISPEDGEILIKSRGVMKCYHQMESTTKKTLKNGWLYTGDIGKIDQEGFLWITDRKKDLIKTSGGKYVAPQALEGKLKALSPLISQVVVHGNRRNFCSALISLEEETLERWAKERGMASLSYQELSQHPLVIESIQSAVDELNASTSRFVTIKKFALLPEELSLEKGELTVGLKVKRKRVERKYKNLLDAFYEGTLVEFS